MKWPFTSKANPRPEPSEIDRHREALRYFIDHRTSIGCYGDGSELKCALAAMEFFASADIETASRSPGSPEPGSPGNEGRE